MEGAIKDTPSGKTFEVSFPYDSQLVRRIKCIPGARWYADVRRWRIPVSERPYIESWMAGPTLPPLTPEWYPTTEPWLHQEDALTFTINKPAALLDVGMGAGKSLMALALLTARKAKHTLLICPKAIIPVWSQQIERHTSPGAFQVVLLGTGSVARNRELAEQALESDAPAILVTNYDSVWREPFADWCLSIEWDVVIADECFTAGTEIATPDGPRTIETLRVGDVVWGFDHSTNRPVPTVVQHTFISQAPQVVPFFGTYATPTHPLWTYEFGYMPLEDLQSMIYTVCKLQEDTYAKQEMDVYTVPDRICAWGTQGRSRKVLQPGVQSHIQGGTGAELSAVWEEFSAAGQYDRAEVLQSGMSLCRCQTTGDAVPALWRDVRAVFPDGTYSPEVLQCWLCACSCGSAAASMYVLREVLYQSQGQASCNEALQSFMRLERLQQSSWRKGEAIGAYASVATEREIHRGESSVSALRPQSFYWRDGKGGQEEGLKDAGAAGMGYAEWRQRNHSTSTAAYGMVGVRSGVASGVCRTDWTEEGQRISHSVQAGYSQSAIQGGYRGRWTIAPGEVASGSRREEGCLVIPVRLDSRTGDQPGGIGEHHGGAHAHRVYNIETGTGNYFAQGVLVHNCHRLQSANSSISKFAHKLGFRARQKLGLSGTPFGQDPLHAYGVYRFLDPSIFGTSFVRFRDEFAEVDASRGFPKVVGYKNQDLFRKKIDNIRFHVSREVLDLPPVLHTDIPITLPEECKTTYRRLERDFYVKVGAGEITASNVLVRALRLQQLTSGFATTDAEDFEAKGQNLLLHNAKGEVLLSLLEDIDPSESVVVFARFVHDLRQIAHATSSAGRAYFEMSGKHKEMDRWLTSTGGVLGVQIQTGAEGQNDMVKAHYGIFYSLPYGLTTFDQACGRLHRPGQTAPVTYLHLVMQETIDQRVYRALQERRDVLLALLEE